MYKTNFDKYVSEDIYSLNMSQLLVGMGRMLAGVQEQWESKG